MVLSPVTLGENEELVMEAIKVRNIAIIAKLPLPYYPYCNVRWVGQEGMSCSYILVIVCTVSTVLTLCIVYIINVGPSFLFPTFITPNPISRVLKAVY